MCIENSPSLFLEDPEELIEFKFDKLSLEISQRYSFQCPIPKNDSAVTIDPKPTGLPGQVITINCRKWLYWDKMTTNYTEKGPHEYKCGEDGKWIYVETGEKFEVLKMRSRFLI